MPSLQRVALDRTLTYISAGNVVPISAATVTVTNRAGAAATVYNAISGGAAVSSVVTDATGNLNGSTNAYFVAEGSYIIGVPGTVNYAAFNVYFEGVHGDGVGNLDPALGVVTTSTSLGGVLSGTLPNPTFPSSLPVMVLTPTSVSSNYTATSRQLVIATAALAVTLPAHSAGQVVGLTNLISAGGVMTINGTNIQGVGLSSASSFTLGTYGSKVVLLDDGTNWLMIEGQRDTGWLALTLTGSIGAVSNDYVPSVRVQGDVARLKGDMINNGGTVTGAQWASVPSPARPPSGKIVAMPATTIFQAATYINIDSSGILTVQANMVNTNSIPLNGISFSLS